MKIKLLCYMLEVSIRTVKISWAMIALTGFNLLLHFACDESMPLPLAFWPAIMWEISLLYSYLVLGHLSNKALKKAPHCRTDLEDALIETAMRNL